MYKLVAIDLDGTMLNSYGELTEETKEILQEKIKKGMEIVPASGRTLPSILPISEEIGGINYIIAGNGSLIYDTIKEQIIYNKFIPKQKILEIIKILDENSIYYAIYTDKEILTQALKYNVLYYHKSNLSKKEENQTKIRIIENMQEYVKNSEANYLKIMVCDDSELIFNGIINKLKLINKIEILDVGHQSKKIIREGTKEVLLEYYYTEISLENVDKWTAIEYLLDFLKIKKEEVIAIGDNINDKKMIQNAGLGIAMGQSSPKVTSIADIVSDTNDNDGVAKTLKNID